MCQCLPVTSFFLNIVFIHKYTFNFLEYTNYIHALQDILTEAQTLILNLSRGYKSAARVDHEWREKMKKTLLEVTIKASPLQIGPKWIKNLLLFLWRRFDVDSTKKRNERGWIRRFEGFICQTMRVSHRCIFIQIKLTAIYLLVLDKLVVSGKNRKNKKCYPTVIYFPVIVWILVTFCSFKCSSTITQKARLNRTSISSTCPSCWTLKSRSRPTLTRILASARRTNQLKVLNQMLMVSST